MQTNLRTLYALRREYLLRPGLRLWQSLLTASVTPSSASEFTSSPLLQLLPRWRHWLTASGVDLAGVASSAASHSCGDLLMPLLQSYILLGGAPFLASNSKVILPVSHCSALLGHALAAVRQAIAELYTRIKARVAGNQKVLVAVYR